MKKTVVAKIFYMLFFLGLLTVDAMAASSPPRKFHSGIFVNRINDFDFRAGTAEVDFWYWVVCDGEAASLQNLELSNGKLEPLGEVITQKQNGKFYISRRYIANVRCIVDVAKFPFDQQRISLSFEDGESTEDQVVFVPDVVNSGIDSEFHMNEWDIKNIEYKVGVHHYSSSFGYLDIPSGQGSDYSQFNVVITLARRGNFLQKLFKFFWPIVVAFIVGVFALLIRVCDADARFGMAVGSLFAAVGCAIMISGQLPQSSGVSIADWVYCINLGFILLFLLESVLSFNIYNRGNQRLSRRLDFFVFMSSLLCYCGSWFLLKEFL